MSKGHSLQEVECMWNSNGIDKSSNGDGGAQTKNEWVVEPESIMIFRCQEEGIKMVSI